MRIKILAIMILFVFITSIQAREDYQYILPDIDTYIAELEQLHAEALFPVDVARVALFEAHQRYVASNLVTAEQLEKLYDVFFDEDGALSEYDSPYTTLWLQHLIEMQLPEDLDNITSYTHFGQFDVEWQEILVVDENVFPKDYRLDVYRQDKYLQTLILSFDNDEYQFHNMTDTPLNVDIAVIDTAHGNQKLWGFIDITTNANSQQSGQLIVLSRGTDFKLAAKIRYGESGDGYAPVRNDFTFLDIDGDSDQEIQHHQSLSDDWGCNLVNVKLYDFDGETGTFILDQEQSSYFYPNTVGCLMRQAEYAMWDERIEVAIDFYTRAFELAEQHPEQTEGLEAGLDYYRVRLLLAYMLTGKDAETAKLIDAMTGSTDGFVQAAVHAYKSNSSTLSVCQAMYDFGFENWIEFYGITDTDDGVFYGYGYTDPLFLDKVTCDLATFVDTLLNSESFTTDSIPIEQLTNYGLTAHDYLTDDMNNDGADEWLIWLSRGIEPIFFYPDGEYYQISRYTGYQDPAFRNPDMRQSDENNQYFFITLPENAGKALVNLDTGFDEYGHLLCGSCGGGGPSYRCSPEYHSDNPSDYGDVTIWRVNEGKLTTAYTNFSCGATTLEDLFPHNTSELITVDSNYDEETWTVTLFPTTFIWNKNSQTYVRPIEPTPIPTAVYEPSTSSPPPFFDRQQFEEALITGNMTLVLDIVDEQIPFASNTNDNYRLRYYRAIALEFLNHTDDALAEYISLYETAANTSWGQLAALHFEKHPS